MGTLRDAVYGLAVGDALGVPFEFRERGTFECSGMVGFGTHAKPAGTWSDDTSLTLATCDSIRELGFVETGDIRSRFRAWLDFGAYAIGRDVFDVGGTTARAIRSGVGCSGERDCGNGSLMRIVPLVFTDPTDDDVRAVSAITHANPRCTEACVDFVRIARRMADGEPVREAMGEYAGVADEPRDSVRSGGYVLDTLRAAFWCVANTGSYESCVLEAVNLGRDTDTTAAVAGALAGIVYGVESIPGAWIDALRGKDIIESCLF